MKELRKRTAPVVRPTGVIALCFDDRQRARLRTQTTSGEEVGLFIERGTSLRDGDHLRGEDGSVYRIEALPERTSSVRARGLDLARVAYHLGNRHVKVQLGDGWLRYQVDGVLDDMVQRLGFSVTVEEAPFEPEGGAYSHGNHASPEGVSFELDHAHDPDSVRHGHAHGHGHHHGHGHR